MDAREAIAKVREALTEVQTSGQQVVPIPALLEFLRAVEQEAPLDAETRKLQHESDLAYYRAQSENAIEMFRGVVESSKIALTTIILVNGGATVALLAFLGNVVTTTSPGLAAMRPALARSIMFFASGVLLAAIATGTTYVTNYCYTYEWKRSALRFHILTIALVLGSYACFLGGMLSAYGGFR
jgi:hypothetical protein